MDPLWPDEDESSDDDQRENDGTEEEAGTADARRGEPAAEEDESLPNRRKRAEGGCGDAMATRRRLHEDPEERQQTSSGSAGSNMRGDKIRPESPHELAAEEDAQGCGEKGGAQKRSRAADQLATDADGGQKKAPRKRTEAPEERGAAGDRDEEDRGEKRVNQPEETQRRAVRRRLRKNVAVRPGGDGNHEMEAERDDDAAWPREGEGAERQGSQREHGVEESEKKRSRTAANARSAARCNTAINHRRPDEHSLVLSGPLIWCLRCGHYAERRVGTGLQQRCLGTPPPGSEIRLTRLRDSRHPTTGKRLSM